MYIYVHGCFHLCPVFQDTVAALMATDKKAVSDIDGVPLFDDRPIDFSGAVYTDDIDGEPLEEVCPLTLSVVMIVIDRILMVFH